MGPQDPAELRHGGLDRAAPPCLGDPSGEDVAKRLELVLELGEVPPRVEYGLTPLGESVRPIFDVLCAWGKHYQQQERLRQR